MAGAGDSLLRLGRLANAPRRPGAGVAVAAPLPESPPPWLYGLAAARIRRLDAFATKILWKTPLQFQRLASQCDALAPLYARLNAV